jgi:diguanylate cyclase (GGDEF)-like protein
MILLVAVLFGAVEILIVRSYVESARVTGIFARNVDSTTFLANVQREFYLYQRELMDSPIEEWNSPDTRQRRTFLMRQVDLLAHTGDSPGFTKTVKAVRYKLMSVNGLVRDPGLIGGNEARVKDELNRRLSTLELNLKRAFDAEETVLFGTIIEATEGREKSQRFLVVLAGLVFLVSVVMITVWGRSVRSRLSKAYSAVMSEMDERMSLETKLTHQAFHDSLTGLANRELFRNDLEKAMARSERHPNSVAVLYLDLDNFKMVNDTFGHEAGDDLLKQVAGCFEEVIRPSDTAARLGGDEFAIILDDLDGLDPAARVAERLLVALRQIPQPDSVLPVHASIGIALTGVDAPDIDHLLRNADYAMYEAKSSGKNAYRMYDPQMAKRAEDSLLLEQELRHGITNGELELHYQPLVSLPDAETVGYEALVRWNHPTRGLLQPAAFVDLAEERGLIVKLDTWVLNSACHQMAEWKARYPEFGPLHVSVNISASHFEDADVVDDVAAALRSSTLEPSALHLEVTESTLMRDKDAAAATLRRLKQLGVSISLDDFGTGYSSLSYLQNFQLDILKIDRSFVAGVASGPEESALTRAIVRIAQSLHLDVVAEGIETAAQATELARIGCRVGQGFLFSRPRPVAAIEAEIAARPEVGNGPAHAPALGTTPSLEWQAPKKGTLLATRS